jgi:hypothetical protein
MSLKEAVKAISEQETSSLTVNGLGKLLKEADIPRTFMGYEAWGNFSHSQVLYMLDGVGYIGRRIEKTQDSTIKFVITNDVIFTDQGARLTQNEISVFASLGLKPSSKAQRS